MLRALSSIVIVAMCAAVASAQQSRRTKTPDRKSVSKVPASWPYSYFDSGHSALNIPFEINQAGMAFVSGRVNGGEPLSILLDTGAATMLALHRGQAERLGLKLIEGYQVQGIGTKRVTAAVARDVSVRLPGITLGRQEATVMSFQEPDAGMEHDAILGFDFFNNFTIVMDYQKRVMSVYAPNTFELECLGFSKVIPINIHQRLPYVSAKLTLQGRILEAPFLLDTGSGTGVILYYRFVGQHRLRDTLSNLTPGSLVGEGGEIKALFLTGRRVELAGVEAPFSPVVGLEAEAGGSPSAKIAAGSLGAPIFRGTTVVFDFPRLRILWNVVDSKTN